MRNHSSMTIIRKLREGSSFIGTAESDVQLKSLLLLKARPFGDTQMIIEATFGIQPLYANRIDIRQSLLFNLDIYDHVRKSGNGMAVDALGKLFSDMKANIAARTFFDSIIVRFFEIAWDNLQELPSNANSEILHLAKE